MSAAAEVAIILFVFFLIGIIVGIIAVIAIPARRPTRRLAARTGQDRPRLRGHITARPCSWRARTHTADPAVGNFNPFSAVRGQGGGRNVSQSRKQLGQLEAQRSRVQVTASRGFVKEPSGLAVVIWAVYPLFSVAVRSSLVRAMEAYGD
jgi:hypothetical protein